MPLNAGDSRLAQLKVLKRDFDELSAAGHIREALAAREAFKEVEVQYYMQPSRDVAETVLSLNDVAIRSLSEGSIKSAKGVLAKSLKLLSPGNIPERARKELRAITLNNLSCCKMKEGASESCLNLLKQALDIEIALYEDDNPMHLISTSMNITVVLSNLGRHREALRYAEKSAQLLHEISKTSKKADMGEIPVFSLSLNGPIENALSDSDMNRSHIKCVAHYNLGVEQEHNRQPDRAIASYRRAQKYVEKGSALSYVIGDAIDQLSSGGTIVETSASTVGK